jgi:DNA-binding NarL/FixJ family response regulator
VIRVLLADDQALVRAGFRLLLESAGDIAVIAEAADGGEAVALTREHGPRRSAHGHQHARGRRVTPRT